MTFQATPVPLHISDTFALDLQEVALLEKIGPHPHIVLAKEAICNADGMFIVLSFCRGGELYSAAAPFCIMPEHRVAKVVKDILQALGHLQDLGKNMSDWSRL